MISICKINYYHHQIEDVITRNSETSPKVTFEFLSRNVDISPQCHHQSELSVISHLKEIRFKILYTSE